MTNYDYIMSKMSPRFLSVLLDAGRDWWNEPVRSTFVYDVNKAFTTWTESLNFDNGNTSGGEEHSKPNIWFWESIYNKDTKKWEKIGKTRMVAFQVWLSKQYNPLEWQPKE